MKRPTLLVASALAACGLALSGSVRRRCFGREAVFTALYAYVRFEDDLTLATLKRVSVASVPSASDQRYTTRLVGFRWIMASSAHFLGLGSWDRTLAAALPDALRSLYAESDVMEFGLDGKIDVQEIVFWRVRRMCRIA